MPWLIEMLGPQYAGKTSIADLAALVLEENATKCLRLETDAFINAFFPTYVELRSKGEEEKAHRFLSKRRPFLNDVLLGTIRKGLDAGYTVIHDHIETRRFRHGEAKRISEQVNAGYVSVFVTVPFDKIKERWYQRGGRDERRIRDLEEDYQDLQALRKESSFTMIIDTSETSLDEAARRIISAIYPQMDVNVLQSIAIRRERQTIENPGNPDDQRPFAGLENVQIVRMKDAYVVIHRHRRFVIGETHFKILQLLDGKNTVGDIAEKAGAELDKVQNFVEYLRKQKIIGM